MNFWMSYICNVSHHLNYFLLKAECFHIFCFRSQLYQNSSFRHPRSYRTSSLRSCRFPFPSCQACYSKNLHHLTSYSPVLLEAEGFHILGVRCQRGAAATATPARKQFLPEGGIYIFHQKQNTNQRDNFLFHLGIQYNP